MRDFGELALPKIIQDIGEKPLVLHSDITGPIKDLTFLRKALLFAELAMISYNDESEASRAAEAIGFPEATLFDNDGSQAFRFRNDHDCVLAFRGTEPNEWNDIEADVNVGTVLAETAGKVHRGFKREVDDLWPMLEEVLGVNEHPLWFCGHSLGGAMAKISAGRCFRSHIASNPQGLFTYGAPRVGDRTYVSYTKFAHYRFVNNNDIVCRLPPRWLGYCHSGEEIYFNSKDRIQRVTGWLRSRDRFRGAWRALLKGKIDALADHKIHRYIDCILNELNAEEARMEQGGKPLKGQQAAVASAT